MYLSIYLSTKVRQIVSAIVKADSVFRRCQLVEALRAGSNEWIMTLCHGFTHKLKATAHGL